MIEFDRVVKRYGAFEALRGVTFSIPKGAIAGLLGPNGSGKTTTIKIAAGLLRRDGGRVSVLGLDPWRQGEELRERVGILHERPAYPLDVSVKVLLKHAAALRGLGWGEALQAAKLAGVKRYLDSPVGALSRGYLQRLGIALALLGAPELLLLDEPTANLDPGARVEVLQMIKTLAKDMGATVVISSHIIPELEQVCDYAVFLTGGVVLAYGRLADLAVLYRVAAEFRVRSPAPRKLAAELVGSEGVIGVEVGDGELVVRVAGGRYGEVEALLEEARRRRLALDWTFTSRGLGELYGKLVASSA